MPPTDGPPPNGLSSGPNPFLGVVGSSIFDIVLGFRKVSTKSGYAELRIVGSSPICRTSIQMNVASQFIRFALAVGRRRADAKKKDSARPFEEDYSLRSCRFA